MAIDLPPSGLEKPALSQPSAEAGVAALKIPFGMRFRENIDAQMAGGTTTTKTVSVTSGPDTDTDPEDSDQ